MVAALGVLDLESGLCRRCEREKKARKALADAQARYPIPDQSDAGLHRRLEHLRAQEDAVSEVYEACDGCHSGEPAHRLTGRLCGRCRAARREAMRIGQEAAAQSSAVQEAVVGKLVSTGLLSPRQGVRIGERVCNVMVYLDRRCFELSPTEEGVFLALVRDQIGALVAAHKLAAAAAKAGGQ
jgi:hypothetical protein